MKYTVTYRKNTERYFQNSTETNLGIVSIVDFGGEYTVEQAELALDEDEDVISYENEK